MKLKIFVSSTCYDLSIIRSQLKSFIENMGYEAVLSEYNDIFYNPQDHTHESCVKEVTSADVVILIIGSRFGGKGIPSLKNLIDFKALSTESLKTRILDNQDKLSVTQHEIFKAIESDIPVYCFVEESVWHDHRVYEENKENDAVIKDMKFPSIEKNDSAPFIFEFINFMRARTHNNAMFPFGKLEDIESCLLKQWSNLFQSLLSQSKSKSEASKQMNQIAEQLNDMKALIMSSVNNQETSKDAAKGVLKYRSLITYIDCMLPNPDIIYKNQSWDKLMNDCDIYGVEEFEDKNEKKRIAIVKNDRTFYIASLFFNDRAFTEHQKDWPTFAEIPESTKKIIVEAVRDTSSAYKDLRYINVSLDEYRKAQNESSKSE
jgi:hypothetical protein